MSKLNRVRKFMISAADKEASYGAAEAVDSLIVAEASAFMQPDDTIIDNQDHLTGTQEPTDSELIASANMLSLNQARAKPHTIATVLAYLLGGTVTTSTPDGATNTRKHRLTIAAGTTLPTTTIEALLATGIQKKYPGAMCNDATLRVQRGANRIVSLQSNWLTSGNESTGSGDVAEVSEASLNAGNSGVWLGAVAYSGSTDDDLDTTTTDLDGSPADIASKVQSIEWRPDNQINKEDQFRLNSGLYYGGSDKNAIKQGLTLDFDYDDETEVDRLRAQTAVSLQWKIRGPEIETGFYYGMNLIFPRLKYQGVQRAESNGKLVNQVTMTVQEDPTYGSLILDLFNEQTAYAG